MTGSGVVCIESLASGDDLAFPLDLFQTQSGERIERLAVDLDSLTEA